MAIATFMNLRTAANFWIMPRISVIFANFGFRSGLIFRWTIISWVLCIWGWFEDDIISKNWTVYTPVKCWWYEGNSSCWLLVCFSTAVSKTIRHCTDVFECHVTALLLNDLSVCTLMCWEMTDVALRAQTYLCTTCCTRILENYKVPVGTTVLAALAMWLLIIHYSFNGQTFTRSPVDFVLFTN